MALYNTSYTFSFEKDFNEQSVDRFFQTRWSDSFIYSAVYVIAVFGLKKWMEKRERYNLRFILALWSSVLAIFSIFGAMRTVPELIFAVCSNSLEYSVCVPSMFEVPTGFWCSLFAWSKLYELGDTLFIVLRKQKLIFLHVYHHITVLIYTWYIYGGHEAPYGRWFMSMNFTVHSVMYTYYALKAMKFHLPRFISMIITFMQITQMIIGCVVVFLAYNFSQYVGSSCPLNQHKIRMGVIIYSSYLILFVHFFYTSYISPQKSSVEKKES